MQSTINITMPDKFNVLFQSLRYKTFYGGRGAGKSHSIARALVSLSYTKKLRILCAREFQTSISDSVMTLLIDVIHASNLDPWFYITKNKIISHTGSEFIFKGLRFHIQEIKSLEGIDICWVEEAQSVSKESWEVLRPTIRKENSEIWISFNTKSEKDPTYDQFVTKCPPDGIAQKVLWSDNPYMPQTLEKERLAMKETDPEAYKNVWEGEPRVLSDAMIFNGKCEVMCFDTPDDVRFFHGLDFGFGSDPTAGMRCFILDGNLFIDREAYGYHIELDDLREFLIDNIPTMESWPIKADDARPETISKLRKPAYVDNPLKPGEKIHVPGLNVKKAAKWSGCVKDRIDYLKSFKTIFIHEKNCPNMVLEYENYKFKTDTLTGEILPIPIDKHNHGWDAIGYSMDEYILNQITVRDRMKAYEVEQISQSEQKDAIAENGSRASMRESRRRKAGAWVQ